ncbi:MAG: LysR family transcriptional regulator [Desulfomonile sp.]|nr:LysR family transcriptional regulator [Desulfomonile sp.]
MEMRRIEIFCKVVELGSFTRAAEALLISQPTVSEHIRGLEDALGERLLDRLGREVLPTPAGRLFYTYARNIVQTRQEAIQALELFKGNLAGHLVLGASTIPGTYLLPTVAGSFKVAHPAVQITIRIADSAEIGEEVVKGEVEVGVVGSLLNERRLTFEELFSDELVLAVPHGHAWSGRASVKLEELGNEPFILRERGSGTRAVMCRILEEHGLDPSRLHVVAEMGSTEAVRQGIKAGIGVSILSRYAVMEDCEHGLLSCARIEDVRFIRPLYLIQRKGRQESPLCRAFTAHLREKAAASA